MAFTQKYQEDVKMGGSAVDLIYLLSSSLIALLTECDVCASTCATNAN